MGSLQISDGFKTGQLSSGVSKEEKRKKIILGS